MVDFQTSKYIYPSLSYPYIPELNPTYRRLDVVMLENLYNFHKQKYLKCFHTKKVNVLALANWNKDEHNNEMKLNV